MMNKCIELHDGDVLKGDGVAVLKFRPINSVRNAWCTYYCCVIIHCICQRLVSDDKPHKKLLLASIHRIPYSVPPCDVCELYIDVLQ